MATTHPLADPDTGNPSSATPSHRRRYVRYLLWAMLIPVVVWVMAFPLVCSRSYEDWGQTQWGPVLEYPYLNGTPDADVVIWGDSSAFIGVDPHVVNEQLGIRSVVLPSTVGSLPVIGDAPLRNYLSHHRQPKLIVLYFSAWNLDFGHMAPGRHFEGEEMMLRHSSLKEIVLYDLQHPLELLAFPIRLYSTFGSKMIVEALHHKSREKQTLASLGHAPFTDPYDPLNDLCRLPAAFTHSYGTATLQELRRKFERPGTQVMVYIAPIPNCTNSGAVHNRSFLELQAAAPALLPPPIFAGDPYYAHIRPPYVAVSSSVFARALQERLAQDHLDLH